MGAQGWRTRGSGGALGVPLGWAAAERPPSPALALHPLQVSLGYLCQACTSLLHSRKMLQHCLQVSGVTWLPAGPRPGVSGLHLGFLSPSEQKWGWHSLGCCPPSSATTRCCSHGPLLLLLQAACGGHGGIGTASLTHSPVRAPQDP